MAVNTSTTAFWHPFADMGAVSRQELVIDRGEGVWIYDTDGRRYLDATASLWYANLGHGRADIADAVVRYYNATLDDDFDRDFGTELLIETARLWASVGHHDLTGAWHVHGVTGPDEYSAVADDNVFTNLVAVENLRSAAAACARNPDLVDALGVTEEETREWLRHADAVHLPYDEVVLVLEGAAKRGPPAGQVGRLGTVHAAGSGDDAIVDEVTRHLTAGAARGRRPDRPRRPAESRTPNHPQTGRSAQPQRSAGSSQVNFSRSAPGFTSQGRNRVSGCRRSHRLHQHDAQPGDGEISQRQQDRHPIAAGPAQMRSFST